VEQSLCSFAWNRNPLKIKLKKNSDILEEYSGSSEYPMGLIAVEPHDRTHLFFLEFWKYSFLPLGTASLSSIFTWLKFSFPVQVPIREKLITNKGI